MNLSKHIVRILETHISDYNTKSYLVAVSGGVDPMVLLHALQCLDLNLTVAHVNYGLRGKDSDLDAETVRHYCKANHIEYYEKEIQLSQSAGIQEQARNVRYDWFHEIKTQKKIDFVVTAHHLDDQAETILQKLSRGTGLSGASGMKPLTNYILRPLLDIKKETIHAYSIANKVPFRTDASNKKNDYTRNKIRNYVFPTLEENYSHVKEHFAKFGNIVSQAESLAKSEAKKTWESNSITTGNDHILDLTSWMNKPYASLILHYILEALLISGTHSTEVWNLCFSGTGKRIATDNYTIWKNRNELIFKFKSETNYPFDLSIHAEGNYDLPQGQLLLEKVVPKARLKTDPNSILIPLEKIIWPLKVRSWKAGDSFQPFGMKGRQKISDLLIQKKIPASQKDQILVLEQKGEILWVVGIRSSEYTRVKSIGKKVLKAVIST